MSRFCSKMNKKIGTTAWLINSFASLSIIRNNAVEWNGTQAASCCASDECVLSNGMNKWNLITWKLSVPGCISLVINTQIREHRSFVLLSSFSHFWSKTVLFSLKSFVFVVACQMKIRTTNFACASLRPHIVDGHLLTFVGTFYHRFGSLLR